MKATLAKLRAPVTITASKEEEGKAAGPPTFSALAYSGTPVPGYSLTPPIKGEYIIDLAGMAPAKNMRANLDHKPTQRVGHLTDYQNDGKQVHVSGKLSAATVHRDEVVGSAVNEYTWEVSIEANLSKSRMLESGKTATVNGRTIAGPMLIFGKSTLTALGFVSNGADEGNSVTIAATAAGAKTMTKFEEFIVSCGSDPETITDEHRAKLQKLYDLENGGGKPVKTFSVMAEDERRENTRQETISRLGKEAMRDNKQFLDQIEELTNDALADNTIDADKFELKLMRSLRTVKGSFTASLGRRDTDPRVIEAAICIASGLPEIEKHYSPQVLEAVDRSGMARFSLQQVLMQVAQGNGFPCRAGERIHVGNIRAVLEYCFPPVTARLQGWSTISLPNILAAVANKQILAGYMEEDPTWREFASVKSVSNFYTQNHFRLLDSLEYEEVGSGGELKHGTLGEETYTTQAKTYGKMLAITRTQIINDDLGAFDDLRTRLGRGASKKFNNMFWAAFLANSNFFTTALTNYIEGSTSNLGTDGVGLTLGVAAFRKMTSPSADGTKRVGVSGRPTKVLVPPELEFIADRLFVGGSPDAQTVANTNPFRGKYRPIVQNRLSDTAFTGYSTTAWYLFGDESRPMAVSFLNGQQTPTVESTDADFEVLGIQFRGYHDFGCDLADYLSGLKSKGAA